MLEKKIGEEVRKLRNDQGFKLEELAERAGITTGYLSKIERGLSSLPIATLGRIASALRVHLSDFFEDRFSETKLSITGPEDSKVIRPLDRNLCYHYRPLASTLRDKQMDPFVVTLEPHCNEDRMFVHQGEEIIYLLEGKMDFFYGSESYVIDEVGTCIYFDASVPHRGQCRGTSVARFLSVISIPDLEDTEFS